MIAVIIFEYEGRDVYTHKGEIKESGDFSDLFDDAYDGFKKIRPGVLLTDGVTLKFDKED